MTRPYKLRDASRKMNEFVKKSAPFSFSLPTLDADCGVEMGDLDMCLSLRTRLIACAIMGGSLFASSYAFAQCAGCGADYNKADATRTEAGESQAIRQAG